MVRETRCLVSKQFGPTSSRSSGVPLPRVTRTLVARRADGTRSATGPVAMLAKPLRLHRPASTSQSRLLAGHIPVAKAVKRTTRVQTRGAQRRSHAAAWLGQKDSVKRGFLETRAVRAPTKAGYQQLMARMAVHVWYWGILLSEEVPVINDEFQLVLDNALSDYCDCLYFEGEPGSLGSQLYSALSDHWPEVGKGGHCALPRFYRARQAWRRMAPGRTRDPLPYLHLVLVVMSLLSKNRVSFAAACLLMWTCYLRPSEVLDLHVGDVLAPSSSCPHVSLLLHPFERGGPSKVGEFDDGVPLDMQGMEWLGPWLLKQAGRRPPTEKLFKFNYGEMVKMFQEAMAEWHLKDPILYRMRHGGASHDIVHGKRHITAVKKRGRWSNDQSLKRYAKDVRLQKVELDAGQEFLARARVFAQQLPHVLTTRDFE